MYRKLRWQDYITINSHWLGLNTATGTLTPLLLPFLVALYAPPESKNTYLATVRVASLAVAMAIQPMAGLLSDRSTLHWGRRRPYITVGTALSIVFLLVVGTSTLLQGSGQSGPPRLVFGVPVAYVVLLFGIVFWQGSGNIAQGALQGLIPDLVPVDQRGKAAGVKSVMELLPVVLIIGMGPLIDAGGTWWSLALIGFVLVCTLSVTVIFVQETPLTEKADGPIGKPLLRLVALPIIFVVVTQAAVSLVGRLGVNLGEWQLALPFQVVVVGAATLLAMVGAILVSVHVGVRVGIGAEARQHRSFVWWVTNRLLFMAAVGSIQGLVLYYITDVHAVANAGMMTTAVLAAVAACLVPAALAGGYLSDRIGRRQLVAAAGLAAAAGTIILVLAPSIPMVALGGCILGGATGVFMATNWALGTELAPDRDAGRYLGISNLAGAGAGIVGVGIGGPVADALNNLSPGLGYLVVFSVYGLLFVLSTATIARVRPPRVDAA